MNMKIAITLSAAALALSGCEHLGQGNGEKFASELRGHTAEFTYHPSETSNGTEYYYPNSNKVLYQTKGGKCWNGSYSTKGDYINFTYPNTNSLVNNFYIKEEDGKLIQYNEQGSDMYQTYEIISDKAIDCTPTN